MARRIEQVFGPEPYSGFDSQYIGGVWRTGRRGTSTKDIDPYTGKPLLEIPLADARDVDDAYRSAAKAQPVWAAMLPRDRASLLRSVVSILELRHDEIVAWLIHESGSTRIKAEFEWKLVYAITVEASSFPHRVAGSIIPIDETGKESRVYRRPIGVVGVISPWNFPMYLSNRSVAPALALGNAVVLKPSEDTPVSGGSLLAKIFEEAGLPKGVFSVVVGASRDIGDAVSSHAIPRLISFTGSTDIGRHITELAAKSPIIKELSLELGGNSPMVVLDDADVDQAVNAAVLGRFMHQGQICMSTNRIILERKISDEFEEKFTDRVSNLKYGNPDDEDTVIGPVINSKQLQRIKQLIQNARSEGARGVLAGEPEGLVVPPHIFADVTNAMKIARTELFGPIAQLITVEDDEEALRVANDTEYGLSSAVCSGDKTHALRFALGIEAGMTHINDSTVDDRPNAPFGGEKNSGIGRFGGEWSIEKFTTDHWVTVQHTPREYPF